MYVLGTIGTKPWLRNQRLFVSTLCWSICPLLPGMISPALLQGSALDLIPSVFPLLCPPEADVGRCQIVQRRLVPGVRSTSRKLRCRLQVLMGSSRSPTGQRSSLDEHRDSSWTGASAQFCPGSPQEQLGHSGARAHSVRDPSVESLEGFSCLLRRRLLCSCVAACLQGSNQSAL